MFQTKCQPSEMDNMPYWKFESFIERLNKKNDEEHARQKKQQDEYKKQQQSSGIGNFNANNFLRGIKRPKI
jgi:hypothetical protein